METPDAVTDRRGFLGTLGGGALAATAGPLDGDESPGVAIDAPSGDGPVDVVVRFAGVDRPDDHPAGDAVSRLRRGAASSHRAFRDFARTTDGVELRREFWLANAVLATVDPVVSLLAIVLISAGLLAYATYRFQRMDV